MFNVYKYTNNFDSRMSLIITPRSSEHCISQFITKFRFNSINV